MKALILLTIIMFLLVMPALSQPTYNVGDPVADFTLFNSDNEEVSLSDYSDQIICLVFWTST